jgi:hypothetical protein
VCSICGAVEYKPYIGTEAFDGGYTTINNFEKSEYVSFYIQDKSWITCPGCTIAVIDAIDHVQEVEQRCGRQKIEAPR